MKMTTIVSSLILVLQLIVKKRNTFLSDVELQDTLPLKLLT